MLTKKSKKSEWEKSKYYYFESKLYSLLSVNPPAAEYTLTFRPFQSLAFKGILDKLISPTKTNGRVADTGCRK